MLFKIFLLSRALAAPLIGGGEPFCNFDRRHHEVHFCEFILNLDLWFRRCGLRDLSGALATLLFGGAEPSVKFWWCALRGTIL